MAHPHYGLRGKRSGFYVDAFGIPDEVNDDADVGYAAKYLLNAY